MSTAEIDRIADAADAFHSQTLLVDSVALDTELAQLDRHSLAEVVDLVGDLLTWVQATVDALDQYVTAQLDSVAGDLFTEAGTRITGAVEIVDETVTELDPAWSRR